MNEQTQVTARKLSKVERLVRGEKLKVRELMSIMTPPTMELIDILANVKEEKQFEFLKFGFDVWVERFDDDYECIDAFETYEEVYEILKQALKLAAQYETLFVPEGYMTLSAAEIHKKFRS